MTNLIKNDQGRIYFFLWLLCLFGSWAVFPYTLYSGVIPASVSILKVFLLGTIQAAVFYGLICWLIYKILPKTDLQPFVIQDYRMQIFYPGVIFGLLVGLSLIFFDRGIFQNSFLSIEHPPRWTGALASIYGAVNEEVLLRLFLFSFIYFIFIKLFRFAKKNRNYFLWTTNIVVALAFGIGHLPFAFQLIEPSSFEIFRILFLNGIAGVAFGWLYWSRGLWSAMFAHFVADLIIHVFF